MSKKHQKRQTFSRTNACKQPNSSVTCNCILITEYYPEEDMLFFSKAEKHARQKHSGQTRMYTGENYVEHPIAVAKFLAQQNVDADIVVAGFLHDVLEDTDTKASEITKKFGSNVSRLVQEVTNPEKVEWNKEIGKGKYLAEKMLGMSGDALTLKLADRYMNVKNINDIKTTPFARTYARETKYILDEIRDKRRLNAVQQAIYIKILEAIEPVLEIK